LPVDRLSFASTSVLPIPGSTSGPHSGPSPQLRKALTGVSGASLATAATTALEEDDSGMDSARISEEASASAEPDSTRNVAGVQPPEVETQLPFATGAA